MAMMILQVLGVLLNTYSFIILVRIIMAWFPNRDYGLGRLRKILATITDPYLGLFKRLRFLRLGPVDLSPIMALVLLSALQIMLAEWMHRGVRSLMLFPVFFANAILNITSLFFLLLFLTIIVRIIFVKIGVMDRVSAVLDRILQPMVSNSFRFLRIKRNMSFVAQLLLLAVVVLLLFFGSRFLSAWLFLL